MPTALCRLENVVAGMSEPGIFETVPRRKSVAVDVGGVTMGGGAPIVVQSMTNTDTADVDSTVAQVAALARAGSEIVRITVDRDEAAKAVPYIRDRLALMGVETPLVGDFHYIGHKLLTENPACAEALAKYRINPGNVGFREKRDTQFSTMIEVANKYEKPVRIGVNWGSLDQELLTRLMDENTASQHLKDASQVTRDAMVMSGLMSAERAEELGMPRNRIIISAKVSVVQDLIAVYRDLASRCDYALHLGLTEAGMGTKGVVASAAGMGILLQEGIGDTIRDLADPGARRRPYPRSHRGAGIATNHGAAVFHSTGRCLSGLRAHDIDRLPGTGTGDPGSYPRAYAGMARAIFRGRKTKSCRYGMHCERSRRIQARQYRHQSARHRRRAGSACIHRRRKEDDTARSRNRRPVPRSG